ncbi:mCG16301, isoform CRA_e, partial [Mus musculus]
TLRPGIEFPNVRGPSPALLPPFSPWQRPGTCAPRSYSEASSPWSAPPSIPSTSGPLCGWRNTVKGAGCKSSWYCPGRCATARVESVV